ncbi:MAG: hypothetical protein WCI51_15840 [Lentisphaerota bacterium]
MKYNNIHAKTLKPYSEFKNELHRGRAREVSEFRPLCGRPALSLLAPDPDRDVNLSDPEGRGIEPRLIKWRVVLCHNLVPGAARQTGFCITLGAPVVGPALGCC